ncbi:glycosyltransferase [Psychrobacillus sp. PGGUH221]|uniref:glycosyltransferase family 2 protein n=1 Tax=Psychrobacillus sp. PGGUH221 TaxID=3020058 RepID=UPI0035C78848
MVKLISVIMTVYNGEKFVADSIKSILNQSYSNFELIIINDGSKDNSRDEIRKYIDDIRIKYIELKENKGVGAAICRALEFAKGEYIAKVDADDIYDKDRFIKQVEYLNNNPEVAIVDSLISYFPDSVVVEESQRYNYIKNILEKQVNSIINEKTIQKYLYWFSCITHSTIMYRSNIFENFSYNEKLRISEDYELFYNLNKANYKIHKIPETLGYIRISDGSTTVLESEVLTKTILEIKSQEIGNCLSLGRKIYIWGTGNLGKQVYEHLVLNLGVDIHSFVDSDPSKNRNLFMGKSVITIDALNSDGFIFIASSIGKFEIAKKLDEYGYSDIYDYFVIL